MAAPVVTALLAAGGEQLVRLGPIEAPRPGPGEALVRVRAVSVNRGELHRLRAPQPGWRPGWDFAGDVVEAPGLAPGTGVFGMAAAGSWAELLAVPVDRLAPIPAGLDVERAAALPVVGLTATRLLAGVPLRGRPVLVTGATGGVGRMLLQLGRRAGARITALVGGPDRARLARGLGAVETTATLAALRRGYDLALDSVGGDTLAAAMRVVAPGGMVRSYGNSSRARTTSFDLGEFYLKQGRLLGFNLLEDIVREPPAADLARLGEACAAGDLRLDVTVVDWRDAATALRDMADRKLAGKAVLRLPDA